jgi:small subunit ribosomal protein S7e
LSEKGRELHDVRIDNFDTVAIMSSPSLNKIAANSPSKAKPSEIETSIANALYDLETNIPDMKSSLRPLQFVSAREVR